MKYLQSRIITQVLLLDLLQANQTILRVTRDKWTPKRAMKEYQKIFAKALSAKPNESPGAMLQELKQVADADDPMVLAKFVAERSSLCIKSILFRLDDPAPL